jgi:glucokinase-like ROK family protein
MKQVANVQTMRQINRIALLEAIRENGPISRSSLSQQLEISLPTVMRITEDLLNEELIIDLGKTDSTGGRPPSLLDYNNAGFSVIGIDLGGTKMYGTVADLAGHVQYELTYAHADKSEDKLELLICFIEKLLRAPRPEGQKLHGIGIGVPGTTSFKEGKVIWAPSLEWRNLSLQSIIIDRFDIPVFIENDVNLAALGEYGFGAGKDSCSFVNISVGTGIGAGIILDGDLYRGCHQAAGEIGFMVPDLTYLGRRYDHFGALESLASGTGIVKRSNLKLSLETNEEYDNSFSAKEVFDLAREGKSWAIEIVQETADLLSVAVGNIAAFFDPEIIILGGGVASSADLLIPRMLEQLDGVVPVLPKIVASPLGRQAAAMGAITLVLNGKTEYLVVNQK